MKRLYKVLIIIISVLCIFFFLLKTLGLSLAKSFIEEKAHIQIKILNASLLNQSITARAIRIHPALEIPKIHIKLSQLSLKKKEGHLNLSLWLPEQGKLTLEGKITMNSFQGTLHAKDISIVGLKEFLQNRYGLSPTEGIAHLESKITIKNTFLTSHHVLNIHDLAMDQRNIAGLLSDVVLKNQKNMELTFSVQGDILSPQFDWTEMVGDAIAQAFVKNINIKNPINNIEDTTQDLLKDVKDLF